MHLFRINFEFSFFRETPRRNTKYPYKYSCRNVYHSVSIQALGGYHAFIGVCTLKYIYILSIIILYRCIIRRSESKKSTTLKLFCTIREKILYLHMILYYK